MSLVRTIVDESWREKTATEFSKVNRYVGSPQGREVTENRIALSIDAG